MEHGIILNPQGEPVNIPSHSFSAEDARLLRLYKVFLQKHGLREALYCNNCWDGNTPDGCEAHVTGSQILIRCRCQLRFFQGSTY
jgi:hypothetical protein